MSTEPHLIPPPRPLDYGHAPRRWRRRIIRATVSLFVIGVAYAALRWGPEAYWQSELLYWQRQCMRYTAPANQVVYEEEPEAVERLLASKGAHSFHYVKLIEPLIDKSSIAAAADTPKCWEQYGTAWGRGLHGIFGPTFAGVIFMHERISLSGNRRLVFVMYCRIPNTFSANFGEGFTYAKTVIIPATITRLPGGAGFGPAVIVSGTLPHHPPLVRIFAGQPDPADASHFTIRYQMWAQEDILDGYLLDDDTITLKPRHPPAEPRSP